MNGYILGDCHCQWNFVNGILNYTIDLHETNPYYVFQVGDFGYFPKLGSNPVTALTIPEKCMGLYFISGNHDDHSILKQFTFKDAPVELGLKIFYMPFGSTGIFGNSKFLFLGGAFSPDKSLRHVGFDWFPNEEISDREYKEVPEEVWNQEYDFVLSHTAPETFVPRLVTDSPYSQEKIVENSTKILREIYRRIPSPKNWVIGHFHKFRVWNNAGTRFTVLNEIQALVKDETYMKVSL